jgi:hypothetical protein
MQISHQNFFIANCKYIIKLLNKFSLLLYTVNVIVSYKNTGTYDKFLLIVLVEWKSLAFVVQVLIQNSFEKLPVPVAVFEKN